MQTPVQPPHHALSQRDELACWRHWIAQGNLAFQSRNYTNALAHYQQARASVRPLLFNASDGADATIAAWVIAHLNLADACEQLGQSDEQGLHLCTAHETLCCATANTHLADDWRMAAWQHSRRTYAELARYARRYPHHVATCSALFLGAVSPQERSFSH
ncbi:hypothetical protein [Alcaligenes sp. Lyrl_28]|uniref:hypothetical protein n=1 Tax=Alcaligenes sp. Lyrl_28 TaxID=3110924 RepID=UPI003F7B5BD1